MRYSFEDLKRKEVIDITGGERLGFVDDVSIELETSAVESLIIYGRRRLFGFLGKEDDVSIPCADIRVVGADVILVKLSFRQELSHSTNNSGEFLETSSK